jgi:hypothetical protein
MLTADSNKKLVLCITDAFTKYAVVTAIANKEAETVVDAIYRDWFAKFGILAQIHTDGGKEFVNFPTTECLAYKNFTRTSSVQRTGWSFQQNREKVPAIVHRRHYFKLGNLPTRTGH